MTLKSIRRTIRKAVSRRNFPFSFNLFLFGLREKRAQDKGIPQLPDPKSEEKPKSKRKCPCYVEIDKTVNDWINSDDEKLMRDFSLSTLSEETGVSRKELTRYFEHYIAEDFRIWKNRMRIDLAMKMILSEQNMNMTEIAFRLGFSDKSNFYRQFKYFCGTTPGIWRNTGGHPEIEDDIPMQ